MSKEQKSQILRGVINKTLTNFMSIYGWEQSLLLNIIDCDIYLPFFCHKNKRVVIPLIAKKISKTLSASM